MRKSKNESDDNVDALFRLPLAEFTSARNGLAAQLKKSGRAQDASDVKALGKPSVSAWAVNQLYWHHRDVFDKLIASGETFHKAQKSGKMSEMRAALDARREALTQLSNVATSLLKEAGHNPSPDTIHRITTTLEGISAYASRDDGPQPGRLTHDVDPPGFESVGSFVPAKSAEVSRQGETEGRKQEAGGRRQEARGGRQSKGRTEDGKRKNQEAIEKKKEEASEKKIAAQKAFLQEAKKLLAQTQTRVRSLEAARTRSQADLKQAEERFKEATKRARTVDEDLENSTRELKDAQRQVEEASRELNAVN